MTAPAAPASPAVQAATNPGRVELTWQASTDNVGVTGYEISRDGVVLSTVAGMAYADTDVRGATAYTYSVVALDAAGNRSAPATVAVTTPDLAPPSAPGAPSAAAADGPPRVALTWTAATDDVGVTGYEIARGGVVVANPGRHGLD